jgi:hypothetical protein
MGAHCSAILWMYVNVRRLYPLVEQTIDRGTPRVVFEPNEEPLCARVRQSVSTLPAHDLRERAPAGPTPEAFLLACDHTTVTPTDIDDGRVISDIGIAPFPLPSSSSSASCKDRKRTKRLPGRTRARLVDSLRDRRAASRDLEAVFPACMTLGAPGRHLPASVTPGTQKQHIAASSGASSRRSPRLSSFLASEMDLLPARCRHRARLQTEGKHAAF